MVRDHSLDSIESAIGKVGIKSCLGKWNLIGPCSPLPRGRSCRRLRFLDPQCELADPLAEGGFEGVSMIPALVEVADPMDPGDLEGFPLAAEEPAEGAVLVGLAPAGGGLLVIGKVVAVSKASGGIAMGDLERTGGPGSRVRFEFHGGRGEDPGTSPALLQGGGIRRQQIGTPFLAGKDKRFADGLESPGETIETALAEEEVAVREPDPVGARFEGGEVASDGPPEELLAGKATPVPGHCREVLFPEKVEQVPGFIIPRGMKDGHGDIQTLGRVRHEGAELVDEKVGVLPAVADDFQMEAALPGRKRPGRRQTGNDPAGGNPALGRPAECAALEVGLHAGRTWQRNGRKIFRQQEVGESCISVSSVQAGSH